ncbi:competence/damage-inducible protein A [Roseospirillum parvum]|uniref:Molybdenum cofactor synthesis domain-containing protein n=1 Tax=Roseospirillum parvum TaxID=83401 RepID=A0A1G7X0R3_9PROT|nr:molybdopterin-binding protein [Roseospirillum parvum]SDG77765.1 molybdenum cofactor synthesis domain-containing protein [Roseospirillum parvum]
MPTAALLIIGNEILSGRTRDANLAFLGEELARLGIPLIEARVVADHETAIVAALNALRAEVDYLFTTGGIGPTHDDITTAAVAKAFGLKVIRHPEAVARLEAHYPDAGTLNAARLKMAEVPDGAALIDNPVSAAPGYRIGNVHVLAGVPSIARAMFEALKPTLAAGAPILSRSLAAYVKEGDLAAPLEAIQNSHPAVDIGSYPFARDGRVGAAVVARGTDPATLETVMSKVSTLLDDLGAERLPE